MIHMQCFKPWFRGIIVETLSGKSMDFLLANFDLQVFENKSSGRTSERRVLIRRTTVAVEGRKLFATWPGQLVKCLVAFHFDLAVEYTAQSDQDSVW